MESSRNPTVCPPIGAQDWGWTCGPSLTAGYQHHPIDVCPQALTCLVSVRRLWNPRGVRVESSRIPRVVHRTVHTCEQQGESSGTTRGRLEDEHGTVFGPPQTPPIHPRVTRRPSPRHHTPGPAQTGSVHRFHSAYYYFSSSSYRSLFKTGCVESRSSDVSSGATRLHRQGEERDGYVRTRSRPLRTRERESRVGLGSRARRGYVLCRSPVPDCWRGRSSTP